MADAPRAVSVDEFLKGQPMPPAPDNLGNLPPESVLPQEARQEDPEPPDEPEPEAPDDDEPVAPDEDTVRAQPPKEDWRQRTQELEARLEQQQRELAFLRAGQSPPQSTPPREGVQTDPLAPIRQMFGGYRVTPQDIQTIVQDPERAADLFTNAMYAIAAVGSAHSQSVLRGEYAQTENAKAEQGKLRDYFYSKHQDLTQYAPLVGTFAQQVQAERPGIDGVTLVEETARRTREQLKSWGVPMAKNRGTVSRISAPRGEMNARKSGGRQVAPAQKDLDNFMVAMQRR